MKSRRVKLNNRSTIKNVDTTEFNPIKDVLGAPLKINSTTIRLNIKRWVTNLRFEEITFMEAMQMIKDGDIEKVYFWIGGSLQPVKNYKSDYTMISKNKYFILEKVGDQHCTNG